MKRLTVFSAVFSLFISACGAGTTPGASSTTAVSQTEEEFCIEIRRTMVDFGVANDLHLMLKLHSVFYNEGVSANYILNDTLKEIFSYLGVYETDIPQWARDVVDREIARAEAEGDYPDFSVFNKVYNELIEDPAYEDLKEPSRLEEFLEVVFRGIIEALGDPFSDYMRAEHWQTGFASTLGRFEGVGISTTTNSRGEISISSVSEGAPAEKAGLKIGDAILKVNGKSTSNCTNQQFVLQMRGMQEKTIELYIAREIAGTMERENLTIHVTKEEVKEFDLSTYPAVDLPDNRGTTLEGVPYRCGRSGAGIPCPFADNDGDGVSDILYVKIHEFTDQMRLDLEHALQELDQRYGLDSFEGVVVDVRDNHGGLVSSTVGAVDFFMSTDDVIFIQRNKSRFGGEPIAIQTRHNRVTYIPADTPIVVIMNENSFSGAEVFAAALRDNGRAVIVNASNRSGGKGTVNVWQTLRKGEYGAVFVSTGMWLTPNGEFVETRDEDDDGYDELGGLKPDIHVPWTDNDYSKNNRDVNYDPTLSAALEWLAEELSK
jgi:carboxyl-terminal processing protease